MDIKYSKQAVKAINKMNNPIKKRIKSAVEKLPNGDIKKLKGYSIAYRLRVGDYRILFDMSDNIEVTDILSRGEAYKD